MSSSVVAVIDRDADTAVVWWIDLGHRPAGMSRMCGAWVIDEPHCSSTLVNLTDTRLVVATAAGRSLMDDHPVAADRVLDVVGTRESVIAVRDQLQAAYEEAVAIRKNARGLIAPSWPDLPDTIVIEELRVPAGDPRTGRALAIARWLGDLSNAWDKIEEQRLARSYLRVLGGPTGRPLPVVCSVAEETSAA